MTEEHGTGGMELACGRGAAGPRRSPFALPGTERRWAPDRVVDVEHTVIALRVDPAEAAIEGEVTHRVRALADDVGHVLFHARELEIQAVEDGDGRTLEHTHVADDLRIELAEPLAHGEEATLVVRYRGTPRRGLYFVRPDDAYPDKPLQAWTQGQDEDSRHWFPCFDHPLEKATTEVRARVPARYRTVSNGVLADREEHDDGTVTWHWKQSVPHAAYLVTLVVAELAEVELGDDPVPLFAYVEKGREDDARRAFGRTAKMMEVFGRRFGLAYPYERYSQIVVSDFIFGGMENTTATTLVEYALYDDRAALDYDADDLIAHELAHQWWGDLLTCRHWSHAWLNEGFATWSESLFREEHLGEDEATWHRHEDAQHYLEEDAKAYRRAIVDERYDEPIDLFDRHLYQKGGWVLHMLRHELGEGPFWRALGAYAERNQQGSVVTDDLRKAVEETTGRSVQGFFDQWVHHGGHPDLEVSWSHDADEGRLAITVKQKQEADDVTPEVFHVTLEVDVVADDDVVTTHPLALRRREQTFHLPLGKPPSQVRVDPRGRLLAAFSGDRPPKESRAILGSDAPLMARLRAAEALGKDRSLDTVEALAAALEAASFWGVAATAADALAALRMPEARDALVAALGRVAHPKARRRVAAALGRFRGDETAAGALRRVLEEGDESLFVEAAAAKALGETRAPFAREVLEHALETKDAWAETIRAGCVAGLGALGDEAVVDVLRERAGRGHHPRLRVAALQALAQTGRRLVVRDAVREALEEALDDVDFRVVMGAIGALEHLGDAASLGALQRAVGQAGDGRVRRSARVAIRRIRERGERQPEVTSLADAVDRLTKENAELRSRLDRLEARGADGDKGDGDA